MNFPVNASGVRFVVLRGVTRELFEASALGALVDPIPPKWRSQLWAAIQGVDARFPAFAASVHRFTTSSAFEMFENEVVLLSPEYIGIRFAWANLAFEASWSNPLWELLGLNVSAQLDKVGARVQDAIALALDLRWLRRPLTVAELPPRPPAPRWLCWWLSWRDAITFASYASGSGQ